MYDKASLNLFELLVISNFYKITTYGILTVSTNSTINFKIYLLNYKLTIKRNLSR